MFRHIVLLRIFCMCLAGLFLGQSSLAETRPEQIEIELDAESIIRVEGEIVEIYQLRPAIERARMRRPDQNIVVRVHPESLGREWFALDKTLKGMKLSCAGRFRYENGQRIRREVQQCRDWES